MGTTDSQSLGHATPQCLVKSQFAEESFKLIVDIILLLLNENAYITNCHLVIISIMVNAIPALRLSACSLTLLLLGHCNSCKPTNQRRRPVCISHAVVRRLVMQPTIVNGRLVRESQKPYQHLAILY